MRKNISFSVQMYTYIVVADIIRYPLVHVVNLILSTGISKNADIKNIYKKG